MYKAVFALTVLVAFLITESSCQGFKIIHPTYRPPPPPKRPIIIRAVREAPNDQPLWLYQGDIPKAPATGEHPFLPTYIDDIKLDPNTRYARSVDSPSARRGGGSHTTSSGSRDTGATHPGYNRRNARDVRIPDVYRPGPFNPHIPRPHTPRLPIYARVARDLHDDVDFEETS